MSDRTRACPRCGSDGCSVGRLVAEHFHLAAAMTPPQRELSESQILAAHELCSTRAAHAQLRGIAW